MKKFYQRFKWTAGLSIFLLFSCFIARGQVSQPLGESQWGPVHIDTSYTSGKEEHFHVKGNSFWQRIGERGGQMTLAEKKQFETIQTATIIIEFGDGFDELGANSEAARNAFRFAANIWEAEVVSVVPIIIAADFVPLGDGIIGSNQSPSLTNVPNAPDPDISYTLSLANAIAGFDLAPGTANANQNYNIDFDFYFETDGNTPPGTTDFVTVVMHEIGHSMGITGISNGGVGVGANGGANPALWDLFVELGDGTPILDLGFGTQEQQDALVSGDLFINSPLSVAALGGQRPKIYAPSTFSPGSSYVHWDENTFPGGNPNSLMTPFIGSGESNFNVGDITRGVLADQGWQLSSDLETQDVGIVSISMPTSDSDLGATEVVVVNVRNFGIEDVSGFDVAYQIDGAPVLEVFSDTIPALSIASFTFSQTADLSEDGTAFSITAFTNLDADQDPSNDSITSTISNLIPSAEVTVTALNFGDVGVGNVASLPVTLKNTASGEFAGEVDINAITFSSALFFSPDTSNLPITVLPGDSIDLIFSYSPLALETNTATATVFTNAGEFEASLVGIGVEPSNISVDPLSLTSFLGLSESESQFIQISNSGASALDFTLTFESVETTPASVAVPFAGLKQKVSSELQSRKATKPIHLLTENKIESLGAENSVYIIDDGSSESNIGLNSVNELMWLNAFQVVGGANVITSISSAVASGSDETPARFILYEDPDDDGDPSNAVFLTESSGILTNPGEDVFTTVSIDPTPVEGVFFVAVLINEDPSINSFPMPQDSGSPSLQSSWAISDSDAGFDVFDLSNNSLPPLLIDDADLPGNWLLRADGQFFSAEPIAASLAQGETVPIQVDFFGTSPGSFSSLINVNSNDPDESVVSVEVNMEVEGVLVTATPSELTETLIQGSTSTQTLTLVNGGANDVSFDIEVVNLGVVPPGSDSTFAQNGHNPVFTREERYSGLDLSSSSEAIQTSEVLQLGAIQYQTSFEDFFTGDVNGQDGWIGQFGNWTVEPVNPSDGNLHFRGLSDGLGQSLAFSPLVSIGSDPFSSIEMDLEVVGTGVTWQVIPQSPTGSSVNTRVQFNQDGTVSVLINDPVLGAIFEPLDILVPTGYFTLQIEVNRSTSEFSIYFDGDLVFEGLGFAGDIEQLVILSLMEVAGPTLDMDRLAIVDGNLEIASSFITPSVVSGVIPGGSSIDIEVSFNADFDFGTYRSDLLFEFNDNPLIPKLVVPAELTIEGPPSLEVSPTVIIEEIDFKTASTRPLTLENTGGEPVNYELSILGGIVDVSQSVESLIPKETNSLIDGATLKKKAYDDLNSPNALRSEKLAPIFSVIGNIILEERFESGVFPPAEWQVIDNEGTGLIWGLAADADESNYTSTGEAATVSSDDFGQAEHDTELRTPSINIEGKSDLFIQYSANYQNFADRDFLDLDVSIDGGDSWITILSWNEDHGSFFSAPGELVTLSLDEFVTGASSMILRWRYYDPNTGDFNWYAQIDDVILFEEAEMWLSIDEPSGQIPVGSTVEVPVNFDASLLDAGDFQVAGIVVNSDAINDPEIGVVVAVDVREPAVADIAVEELSETLSQGNSSIQSFSIQNNGESQLTFVFEDIFFNADPVFVTDHRIDVGTKDSFIPIEAALQVDPTFIQNTMFEQNEEISTNQYATDFEDFLLGDITGQSNWFGQFGNWVVDNSNPFGKEQHLRSISDGLGTTLAFSPEVATGSEPTSSVTMQVNIEGTGVTWDIIPQSPSVGFVNTIVRFNPDGSVAVLTLDSINGGIFNTLPITIPEGYFKVGIEVDRSSAVFRLLIDGTEVFVGQGFTGNIEQLVFRSLMEVVGSTLDVDNIQIIDGEIFNPFVSVSPVSGILQTGELIDISVFFDAQNLEPGIYVENLVVSTNDPEKEKVTIPATLEVLQSPIISIFPAELEILAISGISTSTTINVENLGEVELQFTGISFSPNLSFANGFSSIADTVASNSASELEIFANYDSVGVFQDSITFFSNDPDNGEVNIPVLVTVFSTAGGVTGFQLINARNNKVVGPLEDGASIDVNTDFRSFSIEALTFPEEVGSVVFELDGEKIQVENFVPYSSSGDISGNFNSFNLPKGSYTLAAKTFSKPDGKGEEGQSLTTTFELFNSDSISRFDLINANSDISLGELIDGTVIDLADTSTNQFSIEAFAIPDIVGSVVFTLNDRIIQTENFSRYSASGNDGDDFEKLNTGLGEFVLTATPYSSAKGTGVAGNPLSVSFIVIDSNEGQNQLGAFPNPIKGSGLTISLPETTSEDVEVQIIDLNGILMYSTVDVSVFKRSHIILDQVSENSLNSGVYLVKVLVDGKVRMVRLLRN
ncbi:MAG: choice-of-anchor D domain-containing protein [Bacteroidota bacterium]